MRDHSVTKLLVEHLKLYLFNVMGIRRVEEEKIRLPVDVRGSKTSVLKLSNLAYAKERNDYLASLQIRWMLSFSSILS